MVLFYQFFKNISKVFSGKNLWGHLIAIALTAIIVMTDFDWWWFQHFHHSKIAGFLFPAVFIGMGLPVLLPIIILVTGYIMKHFKMINIGWTLGQAALSGWLVSSFYKSLTGRPGPPFRYGANKDITHVFHFGFWRGGIFWGWPSSHTTVAFSMAFALVYLFPKNKWIRILAPLYALLIGIGVSMSIHWFSDFVAGAIIGAITGAMVGKAFFQRAIAAS